MAGLGLAPLLDESFYGGVAVSSLTPLPYPVSINGRGYVPDFHFEPYRREAYRHRSIAMLRSQADTSNVPGLQSLNPEGLWRRVKETWIGGAGQSFLDRATGSQATTSDETRFRISKGINPWVPWQISLLNDVTLDRASANSNLAMVRAGQTIFAIDGQSLVYGTNTLASTSTTGSTPAVAASSICSNGFDVYVAYGASGLYTCTRTSPGTATQLVSTALGATSICRYSKGRLLVSNANSIYNVTSPTVAALPAALLTHANTDFRWVDVTEGPSNIYMAGYSGDKSLIYRTAVKTDGTELDAPQIAGELPDGEIVSCIQGYLGFLVVGSNLGVRFAQADGSGNLLLGDLIPTNSSVQCFEGQDRFIWYGLTNFDSTSTGLGRMDLRTLNGSAPAYASDLMATTQGDVTSVVSSLGTGIIPPTYLRLFAVAGVGFYSENSQARVATGTLDSGLVSYGIADQKVAFSTHVDYSVLNDGSIKVYVAQDDGAFTLVGTADTVGSKTAEFATDQTLTDHFEMRVVLTAGASAVGSLPSPTGPITAVWPPTYTTAATGPILNRVSLAANPAAKTGYEIFVPVRLHEKLLVDGVEIPCVPSLEFSLLDQLRLTRQVVIYQFASQSYNVTVETLDWTPESMGMNNAEANGVLTIGLKTLE